MNNSADSKPIVPLANNISNDNNAENMDLTKPAAATNTNQPAQLAQAPHPLPAQVQASLELDRRKNNLIPTSSPIPPMPEKKKTGIGSIFKNGFNKKGLKLLFIPFGLVAGLCLLILCLTLTNIDTQLIKISLQGKVFDKVTNNPIENAQIIIDGKNPALSNKDGFYSIGDLTPGVVKVTVKADGYKDEVTDVAISRVLLDYTTKKDFGLTSSAQGALTGKFIADKPTYKFLDDKLIVNDKEYPINQDGTFSINDVEVGTVTLKFQSASFKDIENTFELKAGTNQIEPITLQPAGDIVGEVKSWVKEDIVGDTNFLVENVLNAQISIADDGKFTIKDLEIGKLYKIRTTAKGYNTKDYEVTVKQGKNDLFNFKMVEEGNTVYMYGDFDRFQFYKSDFDGANEVKITNIDQFKPKAEYYSDTDKKIYFVSDMDQEQGISSSYATLAYSIDVNTKQLTRITTSARGIDHVIPNFKAKKMVNNVGGTQFSGVAAKIELMDLTGSNIKTIKTSTTSKFANIKISDNGKYVYYSEEEKESDKSLGFYAYDTTTGESKLISNSTKVFIFDLSADGNKAIFGRLNSTTNFLDLVLYTISTTEAKVIRENYDGAQYQFLKGNDNKIIYFAKRDGRSNIYTFTIDQNKDEKTTALDADGIIKYLYQQDSWGFYITQKGLNIISFASPKNFKLVNSKVNAYNGNEF